MKIEIKVKFSATVPHMLAFSDCNYYINTLILAIDAAEDWLFFSLLPEHGCLSSPAPTRPPRLGPSIF